MMKWGRSHTLWLQQLCSGSAPVYRPVHVLARGTGDKRLSFARIAYWLLLLQVYIYAQTHHDGILCLVHAQAL